MQELHAHASSQDFADVTTDVRPLARVPVVMAADQLRLAGSDLLEGMADGSIVYLVETLGEVEAMWQGQAPAVCAPLHQKGGGWQASYTNQLSRFSVCIIPSAGWPHSSATSAMAKFKTLQGRCKAVKLCPPPPCDLEGPADIQTYLLNHSVADLVKWALSVPGVEPPHRNGKTPKIPLGDGFTSADLAKMELPPIQWLVPGLLPEGCVMLAGRPKTGKSWLALNLALAVASEHGKFLGQDISGPGTVLYFALEDTRGRLKRRLMQMQPDTSQWPERLVIVEEPRSGPEGMREIDQWCQLRTDQGEVIRLIVVDTLGRMRKSPKAGASVYHEDLEAIAPLHALAKKWHCVVQLVDHQRKAAAEDIFDSVTGSLAKTGTVDGTWILERARNQAFAKLSITGRDIEESEQMISFDQTRGLWGPISEQATVSRLTKLQQRILKTMEPKGVPKASSAIALMVGLNRYQLIRQLRNLERDGYISRYSDRQWVYGDPEGEQMILPEGENTHTTAHVSRSSHSSHPAHVSRDQEDDTGQMCGMCGLSGCAGCAVESEMPSQIPDEPTLVEVCPECGALWDGPATGACSECQASGPPAQTWQ